MADLKAELQGLAARVDAAQAEYRADLEEIRKALEGLRVPLQQVQRAWSGSDIGYHARLYFEGFEEPPLHRAFDVEWGGLHGLDGWIEVNREGIEAYIEAHSDQRINEIDERAEKLVDRCKELAMEATIALSPIASQANMAREQELLRELEGFKWGHPPTVRTGGGGYRITRDSQAMSQGIKVPPHRVYAAKIESIESKLTAVEQFGELAVRALRQSARVLEATALPIATVETLTVDSTASVLNICRRFDVAARQLTNRQRDRNPFEIQDEYDVQDLLHALLRLHFEDVRAEEWTPSYAGGSSRMDFLLKREKIVVEVKMTRDGLTDRRLGEELTIDAARYSEHGDCDILICFIHDPDHRVGNPRGLEDDLAHLSNDRLSVVAVVA